MKKALPKAIALATSLGLAAAANAVNVNPDGVGQVLLYPIYTAENGNFTAINVTNTTDQYKAVKVRFLEGMNSKEVLDFNLYLSPFDVWTANVVTTPAGAKITTVDTSCTAGDIAKGFDGAAGANDALGQQFFNYEYQSDAPAFRGEDRTRVGHIEIIEMSDLDPTAPLGSTTVGAAIKHVNGEPGNCAAVRADWDAVVPGDELRAADSGVSGGLYGVGTIVNVAAGTEYGYDAIALDNFWFVPDSDPAFETLLGVTSRHTDPGNTSPSLAQSVALAAFQDGTLAVMGRDDGTGTLVPSGIDAVSAILSKESIKNDYALSAGLNAETDWVVTFPTKNHYVDVAGAPIAPFTSEWNPETARACEEVSLTYWDREERTAVVSNAQFSPRPPSGPAQALCWETNIVSVKNASFDSNVLGGEFTRNLVTLNQGFETGWMRIQFTGATRVIAGETLADGDAVEVFGLPVIGFSAISIQNGDVGGLLSNYGASATHKSTTNVVVTTP